MNGESTASIFVRLKTAAARVRKQPPMDMRAVPIFALSATLLIIEATYIASANLTFPPGRLMRLFAILNLMLIGGLLARRYGLNRAGDALQATTLATIFGALNAVGMVLATRFTTAFADDELAAADQALGIDWVWMMHAVMANPLVFEILRIAYWSFNWQYLAICLALFALNRPIAGWRFVNGWAFALVISTLVYPFFTARGPYVHYGITPDAIPHLNSMSPWTIGPMIESIRNGTNTDVTGSISGMISFPSFHAAAAVLYMRAWWSIAWLRWPMIVLNLLLISAAPVFGYHYYVDLLGGALVALLAMPLAQAFVRDSGKMECSGI